MGTPGLRHLAHLAVDTAGALQQKIYPCGQHEPLPLLFDGQTTGVLAIYPRKDSFGKVTEYCAVVQCTLELIARLLSWL